MKKKSGPRTGTRPPQVKPSGNGRTPTVKSARKSPVGISRVLGHRVPHPTPEGRQGPSLAPPFLVAAIGSSAGGLDALRALMQPIPRETALALLIVQHLSPDEPSRLTELLARHCQLKVQEAAHRMRIEPGSAYVIPPNYEMTVSDGCILLDVRRGESVSTIIDRMFHSVANQYKEKGIAVLLSGGGLDGSAGIREIKMAGGICLAQTPDEAAFASMPRAAIATGMVDAVLTVAELSDELVRLSRHPFFSESSAMGEAEPVGQDAQLRRIFQLLRRSSGIDFSQYKLPTILRRIQRRMVLNRLATMADYLTTLHGQPSEVAALQEDLLIHVTSFFRDPESYEALTSTVLPRLLDGRGDEPIRVWVPGCSTGEEAYSIAIVLLEFLADQPTKAAIQIFGTDVSDRTIDKARAGLYPDSIAHDLSPERLRRFFSRFDGGYRISKALRERCVFARQDLTRDPPFSKLDLIVCRNLLIYLDQSAQRKVLGVFHYALKPNGFLVLGRSETVGPNADLFGVAEKRFKIYSKKRVAIRPGMEFRSPEPVLPEEPRPASPLRSSNPERPGNDLAAEVSRFLIDRYAPAGVVVDGHFRIVRSRGPTGTFLELPTGEASLDIFKMVKPGLLSGLRSALQEARTRGLPVRKEQVRFRHEGTVRLVSIEVTPVGALEERHFLVLFEETVRNPGQADKAKGTAKGKAVPGRRRKISDPEVESLEDELSATREHLQAIIHDLAAANEELQSANEEILSSNEELQSTNEELDTAKEELQSTNEELSTLNDELEARNADMSELNSDLINLLASVQIPIVIVDADQRIRRFTPAAEKTLNLIASDVGRPIGHIRPNIVCPDLESLITQVIDTMTIREQQVEDHEGRLFSLRIRPYRTVDNKIDGAVLTLYDVTNLRDKELELRTAEQTGQAIMSTVREPILLLDDDLRVRTANRAFCQTFRLRLDEIEGRFIYDIGGRGWDIPALREALETVLPQQKNFDAFPVEFDFAGVGSKRLLLDGRRLEAGRPGRGVILLIMHDYDDRAPVAGEARSSPSLES